MTTPDPTRSKAIEVMAEAIAEADTAYATMTDIAEAALAALQAEGMAVVPRERMVDFFAEIDAAIVSVQGALRHYKQPQDVHFHLALKACRDGTAMLSASPYGKAGKEESK